MISDSYKAVLQEMHAKKDDWGTSAGGWLNGVVALILQYDCTSILDYGCGKAVLSNLLKEMAETTESDTIKNLRVSNYDPAIPQYTDKENKKASDAVVCIDVMEHVEREFINEVFKDIAKYTNKVAFFVISKNKAKAVLPDGRNAHITIEGNIFWLKELEKVFNIKKYYNSSSNELVVVAVPKKENG